MRWLAIFVFILFIGGACALSSDIEGTYSQKETAIVKITGNILEPLQTSQFEIKRNNVNIPVDYDLKKIGDEYYVWFISPQIENNYTFRLNNVLTIVNGSQKRIDFEQSFSVSGDIADYYVKPGFGIVQDNFQVNVFSNLDKKEQINIFGESKEISPGDNVFNLQPEGMGFATISVGDYQIPVYINKISNSSEPIDIPEDEGDALIVIQPDEISAILLKNNSGKIFKFFVKNNGKESVRNIYVSYDRDAFIINPEMKIDLGANETAEYNLTIKNTSRGVYSSIMVGNSEFSYYLPIKINFTDDETKMSINYSYGNKTDSEFKCIEIGGSICGSGEECSIKDVKTLDGLCCKGLCRQSSGGGGWGYIGYILIGVLIIGGIFIWYKYYKVKPDKNIIHKKFSEAEEKFSKMP